jgi:phosphoribosylaminoimidazolecarboxamide formyltransferase/IMP cyclohydrolase
VSAVRRALLSVSDKNGLVPLARRLVDLSFEIVSTGGTARALREASIPVTDVSSITGFPEVMDGRVKTLHPAVHGGLLARAGEDDDVLAEHGIVPISLLVVNLYPFERVVADPSCTIERAIENIDVGGPAMLRAAAKNHTRLTVVVDTNDYDTVLAEFANGEPGADLKRHLAIKAFAHTAAYDAAISGYLRAHSLGEEALFPESLTLSWHKSATLRYGENPHQQAALYIDRRRGGAGGVATAEQLQGKPLSFNNLVDADTAVQCALSFSAPACVIVKHANPCGVAVGTDSAAAYHAAYEVDPTSAFGGVIAFNRAIDSATATAIVGQQFVEVVAGPEFSTDARAVFAAKPNVRLLELAGTSPSAGQLDIKSLDGGVLIQQGDSAIVTEADLAVVTKRAPTEAELKDLRFAWTVVRFVKSNAIVYVQGGRTVGIGAGQMSRVTSARIGAMKAEEAGLSVQGSVMASDAFFPFKDSVEVAASEGVKAIIQPGGSMRDDEVVEAANAHGIAMVFTGHRHFRH